MQAGSLPGGRRRWGGLQQFFLSFTVPSNADANGVIVTAHFEPDEHEHEFVEVKDTRIEPTCLEYGTVKSSAPSAAR